MTRELIRQVGGPGLCVAWKAVPTLLATLLVTFGLLGTRGANAQFTAVNSITGTADGAVAATATDFAAGAGAMATGAGGFSTAVGQSASAAGSSSTALGSVAVASGSSSTAIGQGATASGVNSTALGAGSTASGARSTALGQSASAGFDDSTAIGFGAATTRAGQVMIGTATNTYTAPGITSAASKAAQTGPVEVVTSDANGNLATTTLAGLGLASTADTAMLRADIDRNTVGVAASMALSRIPTILPANQTVAVSVGVGAYGGETAMAVGGAAAITHNVFVSGGGTFGVSSPSGNGGAVAVTVGW